MSLTLVSARQIFVLISFSLAAALATVAVGLVKGLCLPIAFGQDLPGNAYFVLNVPDEVRP